MDEIRAWLGDHQAELLRLLERLVNTDSGCFVSALGVPVLDAMGPLCHDICGETERIELGSIVPRTALIAGIVARLAGQA